MSTAMLYVSGRREAAFIWRDAWNFLHQRVFGNWDSYIFHDFMESEAVILCF